VPVPAREKLNSAFFQGSVLVAALAGWACSSWAVCAVTLVTLLVANLVAGDIRPGKRGR
jgi:hypothetical protein